MSERHTVGVVGARGHTGAELVRLIRDHPSLELVFAGSRELAREPVPGLTDVLYESIGPEDLAGRDLDVVILALPDGAGDPYVGVIDEETVIVDISADHRFDDTWTYGLPELFREKLNGARRIANPGCYATATQIALAPLLDAISGVPAVFGVSGYSGAGTTPGPRNNPERLRDNLMPIQAGGTQPRAGDGQQSRDPGAVRPARPPGFPWSPRHGSHPLGSGHDLQPGRDALQRAV